MYVAHSGRAVLGTWPGFSARVQGVNRTWPWEGMSSVGPVSSCLWAEPEAACGISLQITECTQQAGWAWTSVRTATFNTTTCSRTCGCRLHPCPPRDMLPPPSSAVPRSMFWVRPSLLPSLGAVPRGSSACVLSTSWTSGGQHIIAPSLRELSV